MPSLVRKLIILAAVDGLILQPYAPSPPPSRSSNDQQQHRGGDWRSGVAPPTGLKIGYAPPHSITRAGREDGEGVGGDEGEGEELGGGRQHLETYGIVGLLRISNYAYLISISRRSQVAQLWGRPVYMITGVSLLPLSSQTDAQNAIDAANKERERAVRRDERRRERGDEGRGMETEESDFSGVSDAESVEGEDEGEVRSRGSRSSIDTARDEKEGVGEVGEGTAGKRRPGIVEQVIGMKGAYGKFTERWLLKGGGGRGVDRAGGGAATGAATAVDAPVSGPSEAGDTRRQISERKEAEDTQPTKKTTEEALPSKDGNPDEMTTSLLPKIVQTTKSLFESKTFFYSYDVDITRSLRSRGGGKPSDVPLYKQVDPQYFWNRYLARSFTDRGFPEYVVPIMQGFVGQRLFTVPSTSTTQPSISSSSPAPKSTQQTHLLTLITRRSTHRAGLRFLRRGIDESGHVANSNETEQILSPPNWQPPITSFVQTRGSIPVFFTQTPYTFKPTPVLTGTDEANARALRRHFSDMAQRYGRVMAVSLVDRHGTEVRIGEAYERRVGALNEEGGAKVEFEWFDFHAVCRGMKFEKVALLVDDLAPFLDSCGWTAFTSSSSSSNQATLTPQTGIIRTNCMDCLDRTNVAQSALAAHSLTRQLSTTHSLDLDLSTSPATTWFNTLWADNGDAVSRAYAGTPALKGDYTRTRQRSALGALADFSHTLARYRKGLFADGFAQACVDFLLGGVGEEAFDEFEARFVTGDPGVDVTRARQEAITAAADVVVGGGAAEDGGGHDEELRGGWVLAAPHASGTLRTFPFEEAVLLLTDAALYAVRFDWAVGKVRAFERVELARVQALTWGAYVTETNMAAQMDERRNVGFVVSYGSGSGEKKDDDGHRGSTVRVNTRSLDTTGSRRGGTPAPASKGGGGGGGGNDLDEGFLAFKALPARSSILRSTTDDSPSSTPQSPSSSSAADSSAHRAGQSSSTTERDLVRQICSEIHAAASQARGGAGSEEDGGSAKLVRLEEREVISADEARRRIGYAERIGYGVRRLVWG